jgi:hypothetical protein
MRIKNRLVAAQAGDTGVDGRRVGLFAGRPDSIRPGEGVLRPDRIRRFASAAEEVASIPA